MNVVVNGEDRELASRTTVAELVRLLGRDPDRPGVAVAVGGEVVPRATWAARELAESERVEVVAAVQGGSS